MKSTNAKKRVFFIDRSQILAGEIIKLNLPMKLETDRPGDGSHGRAAILKLALQMLIKKFQRAAPRFLSSLRPIPVGSVVGVKCVRGVMENLVLK